MVARGEIWWYEHPMPVDVRLILTRSEAVSVLDKVLGVPSTLVVRGIPTEVPLDEADGMPAPCVLTLDNASLIRKAQCMDRITRLGPVKMLAVCEALRHATAC